MTDADFATSPAPATATSDRTGCVHCHAPLLLRTHETIQVLACPAEHGLFINSDALQVAVRDRTDDRPESEEQAAEAAQRPFAVAELEANEGAHACPTCGATMSKRVFAYESGVPIDLCVEHGIWLDQGELERIEAWYEAQERHRDSDRAEWGGQTGRLEQIEQEFERTAADDEGSVHWGPVGWVVGKLSYGWARRDDI